MIVIETGRLREDIEVRLNICRNEISSIELNNEHGLRYRAVKSLYDSVYELHRIVEAIAIATDGRIVKNRPKDSIPLKELDELIQEVLDIDIKAETQKRSVVYARHIFRYLAKKFTNHSLKEIGSYNEADHTTVIHSVKTCRELMETDEIFKSKVYVLIERLNSKIQSRI